jgi:hypothetical protein
VIAGAGEAEMTSAAVKGTSLAVPIVAAGAILIAGAIWASLAWQSWPAIRIAVALRAPAGAVLAGADRARRVRLRDIRLHAQ